MPVHSNVRICTHIKVTGVRCGSPALRGEQFCYFHKRMVRGVSTPPNSRVHPIALIENEEAIQASPMEVINAQPAASTVDPARRKPPASVCESPTKYEKANRSNSRT